MLERFWDLVGRHGAVRLPRAEMRRAIGEDAVRELLAARWLERAPLEPGDRYPCPSRSGPGCPRQVVSEGGRLVAVCGSAVPDCGDVQLDGADAEKLGLSRSGWASALTRLLELVGAEASCPGEPARLGERRIGSACVAFYLAVPAAPVLEASMDALCERESGRRMVLVVVRRRFVPAGELDGWRRRRVAVLALDETVQAQAGMRMDLAELVRAERFPGVDPGRWLTPRYPLVLDPQGGRYWYLGRVLPLERRPRTAALLCALAARAGEAVTRDDLCRWIWADSYGGKGTLDASWDRRIRDHKKILAELLGGAGAPPPPIEAVAHGSDVVGGYRLAISADRVAWWSKDDLMA